MKMILPVIIFLSFFRLQCVLSTSNNCLIFGFSKDDESGRYRKSLANLLETFASQTTSPGFYNFTTSFPNSPNQLYGHYLCRGDVDQQACQSCLNFAKNDIPKNFFFNSYWEGLASYDHCMIRYSNQSFFGKLDDTIMHGSFSLDSNEHILKGIGIPFRIILRDTLKQLAINASDGQNTNRFASKVVQFTTFQSYVAVQCTPDLAASACHRCLANANKKLLMGMCDSVRGRVHYSSCMVEYKNTVAYTNNKAVKPSSLSIPISPAEGNGPPSTRRLSGTQD